MVVVRGSGLRRRGALQTPAARASGAHGEQRRDHQTHHREDQQERAALAVDPAGAGGDVLGAHRVLLAWSSSVVTTTLWGAKPQEIPALCPPYRGPKRGSGSAASGCGSSTGPKCPPRGIGVYRRTS